MKFLICLFSLLFFHCLFVYKDKNKIDLIGSKQNQSDVDIVYSIRGKKLVSKNTDEEYSASLLLMIRKENYFANPKVFSKNEYFFINDFSKYKIELDIEMNDNFDNSSLRDAWMLSSIFTFGLIPFYSKTKYFSKMKIFSRDKKILKEFEYENEVDLYFHLFLLPISLGNNENNKTMNEIFKKTAKEYNLLK